MQLAKHCIDVGLFTNKTEAQLSFWGDEVGLPYEEALVVGPGQIQHRFGIEGSVLKINHSTDPLSASGASGYRKLLIARSGKETPELLTDPDGNDVELVPPGHQGVSQLGVELVVGVQAASLAFYQRLPGFRAERDGVLACGRSLLMVREADSQMPTRDLRGFGYRYLTIQIHDLDSEHARLLASGAREGMAPVRLGDTAKFSFVRDPDGNWIEISQRASLTGPLD